MADDAALDDGQFFNADFNAQVSARDHDNVCGQDDIVNVADSLLVFNFATIWALPPKLSMCSRSWAIWAASRTKDMAT